MYNWDSLKKLAIQLIKMNTFLIIMKHRKISLGV